MIIKEAYKIYDFFDEDIWLEMLDKRNDLTHIYDGNEAHALAYVIIEKYIPEFKKMEKRIMDLYGESIKTI